MGASRKIHIFIIPLIVCICSLSIILLSIRFRWLGSTTRTTINYCEISRGKFINEPINTWSSLGFVISGLVIAWQLMWGSFNENVNFLTRSDFTAILFPSLIICVGPSSMAWHATYTHLGGTLDISSMYLVAAFLVAYSMRRFFDWTMEYFIGIIVVVFIICEVIAQWTAAIPVLVSVDIMIFAVVLTIFSVTEILFVVIRRPNIKIGWGIAGFFTFLMAVLFWSISKDDGPLCIPKSWFQGHAIWHLLVALGAYFHFRYCVSEHNIDQANLIEEPK
jgi:predicted membrane channel-forming protein YqfA (hemolysin III family)